jgi:plastocyanin
MRALRILALVTLTVAALAVAVPSLAGAGGSACPAYSNGDATLIVLLDNCFGPMSATAAAGATLTVRNDGQQHHTYTALDGSFDTGSIRPGESVTIEMPETAGVLPVYCTLHADGREGVGMAGTIALGLGGAEMAADSTSAGLGSQGLALAGGFVLGSATLALLRRRGGDHREPNSIEA